MKLTLLGVVAIIGVAALVVLLGISQLDRPLENS
jgi:hypothetical protein